MSLATAERSGFRYVVLSGVASDDRAAVDELKQTILTEARQSLTQTPIAESQSLNATVACSPAYYVRYLQYWTFAEGANVEVAVYYKNNTYNCDGTIWIYQSRIVLLDALNPGRNLYWDQEYYDWSASYPSWDMLCKTVSLSPTYEYMGENWKVWPDSWFSDETINEDSPNCDWYGEEYVGSIILDS